jgi:F1F0 ATPase subunit 2
MYDPAGIILSVLAGLGLGLVHFGLLWITVLRVPVTGRPGLLMSASYVVRLAIVVGVMYLIAREGNWVRVLAALAGFLAGRYLLVRRLKPRPDEDRERERT